MLEKHYTPNQIEEKIYSLWEQSGYFNPDNLPVSKKQSAPKSYILNPKFSFSIIMPPPNANGSLHIGHALVVTLEDIMIRFARMRGKKTLWLPGADHAGFETQTVYDKKLEKEGRNRFQIPREELYKEMYAFTQEKKKVMEHQLRKLGASCDWSREKFTLDPDIVEEVQKTFIKMHKEGLIYRGLRTVNWCVKHQTALSDLEVRYVEQKDPLYYMKYGPFTLATVRPETKFGDTAVAVNPKDSRYKKYIGKEIEVEGLLGKFNIRVIADKVVDPEFGTGVIKVTPAHDPVDFEISQRHNLEIKQVIDRYGKLNEKTGPYQGLKVDEARKKVAEDLEKKGLLVKTDNDYTHSIATCYRCGKQLEPLPIPQWFVKMEPLAKPAIEVVEKGKIDIIPAHRKKVLLHWMKNIKDWNISRQIIWGIRIPAWFKGEKIHIGEKSPKDKGWVQDPDVFDTWFSSGQWPYLTLGFKNSGKHGKDFKESYPTSVMETAADILFFWVARMIMLGLYRTGKIPFRTVYLHGLILDKDKQKMSKSRGNVIDPLGVAADYGTDAVRMALIAGNTPGRNSAISEDKIRGYRNFATKLWNIARFISINYEKPKTKPSLTPKDKKHLKQLETIKKKVTKHLEKFEFHRAAELTYHYIWHTFADKILEEAKPNLSASTLQTLITILTECLKMLHPFMPFVTEEIFQHLKELQGKKKKTLLMVEPW